MSVSPDPRRARTGGRGDAAVSFAAAALVWAADLPVLGAVLTDADRGLDAMDESHYLMAAQPWADGKAFNGVFGWYSAPLLRLVGDDLASLRVLAALLLAGCALLLAGAVRRCSEQLGGRRWPPWLRGAWPPAAVAAAMCYYTVFVRTPSYNWFAAAGLMLLAAGLLLVIGSDSGSDSGSHLRSGLLSGVLVATGLFLTAVGKSTTALGALAIAAGVALTLLARRRRPWAAVVGATVTGVALAAGHLLLVAPLDETVRTYRRASGMLAVVDPRHYATDAIGPTIRIGLRNVLLDRPLPYLRVLLVPMVVAVVVFAATVAGRSRTTRSGSSGQSVLPGPGLWLGAAFALAWGLVLAGVLVAYPGGVPGLAMSAPAAVLVAYLGAVAGAVAWMWHSTGTVPSGGRPAAATLTCLSLLALGAGYPLGTNVEYSSQLHGAFPVLVAAGVIGVSALPDRGSHLATAALVVGSVVLGGVLVPTTRQVAPYRIASFEQQTIARSVSLGSPPLLLDPDTVAWVDTLRTLGTQGGFRPGTPVLDLTWHPASVLVLDGRAPSVLLPAFPGWPDPGGAAAFALTGEDPAVWRQGWLLVPFGQDDAIADTATRVLDRRFPSDYELIGTVVAPYDRQVQGLWRPRRPGLP